MPLENIFQPVQRQIISELAGHDVGQQPRTGKALLDRRLGFRRCLDLWIFSGALTTCARILLTHVPYALEAPGNVFDLPAFLAAYLFALHAAARTTSFFRFQLVDLRGNRKIFEVGQSTPPLAPLHAPLFWCGFCLCFRDTVRRKRFLLEPFGEVQQRLRQFSGAQAIRPRPIGPFLVARQFHLQPQILEIQFVGSLALLCGFLLQFFDSLLFAVALTQQ